MELFSRTKLQTASIVRKLYIKTNNNNNNRKSQPTLV